MFGNKIDHVVNLKFLSPCLALLMFDELKLYNFIPELTLCWISSLV